MEKLNLLQGTAMVICLTGVFGLIISGYLNGGVVELYTPSFYVWCGFLVIGMISLAFSLSANEHGESGWRGVAILAIVSLLNVGLGIWLRVR